MYVSVVLWRVRLWEELNSFQNVQTFNLGASSPLEHLQTCINDKNPPPSLYI